MDDTLFRATTTHFSRAPENLATAYVQTLTKWGKSNCPCTIAVAVKVTTTHDTKLLMNMDLSDAMV